MRVQDRVQAGSSITANLFAAGSAECKESSVRNAVLRDSESSTFAQSRAYGRGFFLIDRRHATALDEMHAYTVRVAPGHSTIALDELWLDQQRKLVWDANRTLDFERRASLRHVPDDTVDGRSDSKNDGAALIGSQSRTPALF